MPTTVRIVAAIEATLRKWRSEGAHFIPGSSRESIRSFEETYGVTMPSDVRAFFQTVGGMGGTGMYETDSDMLAFWPLFASAGATFHVAPLPTVWESAPVALHDLFVLGDYSIMCFVFCARMTSTPSETSEIYFYDGGQPYRIASGFGQFLHRYVEHGLDALFPADPNAI